MPPSFVTTLAISQKAGKKKFLPGLLVGWVHLSKFAGNALPLRGRENTGKLSVMGCMAAHYA
jgi:hypothetical protein